ncbi:hypothetical protein BDN72DRAFT_863975 [Pluteus cervinus]|uniref:Uncharacterized protein n=1 Tax=Pluteus cervinus TaxID=181527 RepID=A0ACD3A5M4_9AGAR|nr:hypothetical protein BDN72DRAFT_863975 [Pluteus cervinus]
MSNKSRKKTQPAVDPQRTKRTTKRVAVARTNVPAQNSRLEGLETDSENELASLAKEFIPPNVIAADELVEVIPPETPSEPAASDDMEVSSLSDNFIHDMDVDALVQDEFDKHDLASDERLKASIGGYGLLYVTSWQSCRLSFLLSYSAEEDEMTEVDETAEDGETAEGARTAELVQDLYSTGCDPFSPVNIIPAVIKNGQLLKRPSTSPYVDDIAEYSPSDIKGTLELTRGLERCRASTEVDILLIQKINRICGELVSAESNQDEKVVQDKLSELYKLQDQRQEIGHWVVVFFNQTNLTSSDVNRLRNINLDKLLGNKLHGETVKRSWRKGLGRLYDKDFTEVLFPRLLRNAVLHASDDGNDLAISRLISKSWLEKEILGVFGSVFGHIFTQDLDRLLQIAVPDPHCPSLKVVLEMIIELHCPDTAVDRKVYLNDNVVRWKTQLQAGSRSKPDLWIGLMPLLDQLFLSHFHGVEDFHLIGSIAADGSKIMIEYMKGWLTFVDKHCQDFKVSSHVIAVHGLMLLCPLWKHHQPVSFSARPFLSSTQMVGVYHSLEHQREAWKETLRWFESLTDMTFLLQGLDASACVILLIHKLAPGGHNNFTPSQIAKRLFDFILCQTEVFQELNRFLCSPLYESYRVQELLGEIPVRIYINGRSEKVFALLDFVHEPNQDPSAKLPAGARALGGTVIDLHRDSFPQSKEMVARLIYVEYLANEYRPFILSAAVMEFRESVREFLSAHLPQEYMFWDHITPSHSLDLLSSQDRAMAELRLQLLVDDRKKTQAWLTDLENSEALCNRLGGQTIIDPRVHEAINTLLMVSEENCTRRRHAVLTQDMSQMPPFMGTIQGPLEYDRVSVGDIDALLSEASGSQLRDWFTSTRSNRLDVDGDARCSPCVSNSSLTRLVSEHIETNDDDTASSSSDLLHPVAFVATQTQADRSENKGGLAQQNVTVKSVGCLLLGDWIGISLFLRHPPSNVLMVVVLQIVWVKDKP